MMAGGLVGSPALADKANQVTLSVNTFESRYSFSGNYIRALSGSLQREGFLLRFGASVGGESDGDSDGDSNGSVSVDAMAGYQFVHGGWKARAFGGAIYTETDDVGVLGFKLAGQVFNRKSDPLYISANAGYSSPREFVSAGLRVGGHIGDLVVGPEISGLFAPDFTRSRIGVFLTGVDVGEIGLTFRAGYTGHHSDAGSRGGAYAGMSGTLQY